MSFQGEFPRLAHSSASPQQLVPHSVSYSPREFAMFGRERCQQEKVTSKSLHKSWEESYRVFSLVAQRMLRFSDKTEQSGSVFLSFDHERIHG